MPLDFTQAPPRTLGRRKTNQEIRKESAREKIVRGLRDIQYEDHVFDPKIIARHQRKLDEQDAEDKALAKAKEIEESKTADLPVGWSYLSKNHADRVYWAIRNDLPLKLFFSERYPDIKVVPKDQRHSGNNRPVNLYVDDNVRSVYLTPLDDSHQVTLKVNDAIAKMAREYERRQAPLSIWKDYEEWKDR